AVLPIDLEGLRRAHDAGLLTVATAGLVGPLVAPGAAAKAGGNGNEEESFVDRLRSETLPQRQRLLEERLVQQASSILRLAAAKLDRRTPLGSYGLNSLMALELRNRIEGDLGVPLSATVLWNYPTVTGLAEHLLSRLAPFAAEVAVPEQPSDSIGPSGPGSLARAVDGIAALSDEAALAMLAGGRRDGRSRR